MPLGHISLMRELSFAALRVTQAARHPVAPIIHQRDALLMAVILPVAS